MEQSRLQIALTVFAMLFPAAVTAQNPCGYAFTITGEQLYDQQCAACHGKDGKGHCPLAAPQKTPPADLTKIEQRNGGQFPGDRIAETSALVAACRVTKPRAKCRSGARCSPANAARPSPEGRLSSWIVISGKCRNRGRPTAKRFGRIRLAGPLQCR